MHIMLYWMQLCICNFELRFSKESLELANSIDNFIKLNMNEIMFIDHYQVSQLINIYTWNVIIIVSNYTFILSGIVFF